MFSVWGKDRTQIKSPPRVQSVVYPSGKKSCPGCSALFAFALVIDVDYTCHTKGRIGAPSLPALPFPFSQPIKSTEYLHMDTIKTAKHTAYYSSEELMYCHTLKRSYHRHLQLWFQSVLWWGRYWETQLQLLFQEIQKTTQSFRERRRREF